MSFDPSTCNLVKVWVKMRTLLEKYTFYQTPSNNTYLTENIISLKLIVCILEAKKSIADFGCTLCVAKFANETDTTLSKIPYVVSIGNFTPNLNFQTRHGSNIQVVELHRLLVAVWTLKFKSIMKFMYLWDLSSLFGNTFVIFSKLIIWCKLDEHTLKHLFR